MEAERPPSEDGCFQKKMEEALHGIHATLKELIHQIADVKHGQALIEGRILVLELEADAARRASQVSPTPQVCQPPQPAPQPSQSWAFVAAKPKSGKRPAEGDVCPPVFNPFAPLESISEEKKVRKLNPPTRVPSVPVTAAPGPSRASSSQQSRPPGAPGPSGRSTAPNDGLTIITRHRPGAHGPTPGPLPPKSGSKKGQKKTSSKDLPPAAPPTSSSAKGKSKAAKPQKFKDVAMASSPADPLRPAASMEVVPQVQHQVPQVPRKEQHPAASKEVIPQVMHQVPQVPNPTQDSPSSSEVDPPGLFQAFQVPQDEENMETEAEVSLSAPSQVPVDSAANPASSQGPSGQVPAARTRVPPIVIRDDSRWIAVTKAMAERRLNFSKAKTCADGIRVQPVTVDDFRGTTRLLDSMRVSYHTYTLKEDKTLRVVLRPVPVGVSSQQILDSLNAQGFEPIQVTRMVRGRKPMPLVLVEVPARKKDIFSMKTVCNLVVSVEKQLKPDAAPQCHGCQRFFHCARNCRAQVRCVKCAGNHVTRDCPKESSTPAKCANCGGVHTANYRGCPVFPKGKGNGKAQGKPKAKPAAPKAKPDLRSRKPTSPQPNIRQEVDLQLKRTQIQHSIAAAKDQQSLKQALLNFLSLI